MRLIVYYLFGHHECYYLTIHNGKQDVIINSLDLFYILLSILKYLNLISARPGTFTIREFFSCSWADRDLLIKKSIMIIYIFNKE